MYFCRRCNITLEDEELGSYRQYHSYGERDVYEDLTDYDCPECGRELIEAVECSECGCAVELDLLHFSYDKDEPVCRECYYKDEERPSIIKSIRRRARAYGELIYPYDRVGDPA